MLVFFKIASFLFSLLFIFTFLTKITYANQDPYNYAPNNSFEEGTISPAGWTPIGEVSCNPQNQTSNSIPTWEENRSRTGKRSLALKNINWPSEQNPKPSWITSDFIPVNFVSGSYGVGVYLTGDSNNSNLRANMFICLYDSSNNNVGLINTPTGGSNIFDLGWDLLRNNIYRPDGSTAKIKIGLTPLCSTKVPCSGSVWFDDISVRPEGSDLMIRKFNDLNKNGQGDLNEPPLEWEFQVYDHNDCVEKEDRHKLPAYTGQEGYTILLGARAGEYSVREIMQVGWSSSTPICQNVTVPLKNSPIGSVVFGNYQGPSFPYLSQLDPLWASQEYDHGNTIGPFFCGTTIGGCGCAITSSAMILKYHGTTKSPTGEETNPATLNNWLKNNGGYAFGALKWNSVASYSVKANQAFGTQKIRFVGTSPPNSYSTLDTNLANNDPAILQEPGHFIVAKSKQSPTYAINDPAFPNKTTLNDYSNNFLSMRRFEKTNTDLSAIYISTPAPNDLLITDSQGRRAGKDPQTGQTFTDIPNSFYFLETAFADQSQTDPQTPPADSGVNMLVIINPEKGAFDFSTGKGNVDISFYDQNGDIIQKEFTADTGKTLNINYSPIPGEISSFLQKIQIDIIPTSTQNRIYPKSGNIEILVKKTSQFNPTLFDVSSALLGEAQKSPYKSKNGKKGLNLYFKVRDLNLSESDRILCLAGQDSNGIPLHGCDFIKVHR